MQPKGTQPAQACPNCGAGAEHQEESGCLTLSILFYLIFLSIATFLIVTHPPIDWLSLSIYIIIFIISLFFVSSWGRPLLNKFPFLSNTPLYYYSRMFLLLSYFQTVCPEFIANDTWLAWITHLLHFPQSVVQIYVPMVSFRPSLTCHFLDHSDKHSFFRTFARRLSEALYCTCGLFRHTCFSCSLASASS